MTEAQGGSSTVRWEELKPDEFHTRLAACPIVYLPMGLVEPHGQVAALGLDTIKAEWLCDQTAARCGGIVAPTQNWHVHETGYHAPWLEEVVGEHETYLGSLPPHVLYQVVLYQLRAFVNAGFRAAVLLSGHCGGNERDLERIGRAFQKRFGLVVLVLRDVDLVSGVYAGDHAGKFELSQLLAIRPDLVDLSLLERGRDPDGLGRQALGEDAAEASAEHGRAILGHSLARFDTILSDLKGRLPPAPLRIALHEVEALWAELRLESDTWTTLNLYPGQRPTNPNSRWHPHPKGTR
jgi:creatinine amidohydrolase